MAISGLPDAEPIVIFPHVTPHPDYHTVEEESAKDAAIKQLCRITENYLYLGELAALITRVRETKTHEIDISIAEASLLRPLVNGSGITPHSAIRAAKHVAMAMANTYYFGASDARTEIVRITEEMVAMAKPRGYASFCAPGCYHPVIVAG